MLRLFYTFITFIFCLLLTSPQVHAYLQRGNQGFLYNHVSQLTPTKTIPEIPPEADVVAEVIMTNVEGDSNSLAFTAYIEKVIKTSDKRIRQGDEIYVAYTSSVCGPTKQDTQCPDEPAGEPTSHSRPKYKHGDKGTIIAKLGTDVDGHFILCPYIYYSGSNSDPINDPMYNDCFVSEIKKEKQNKVAAKNGDVKAQIALGLMYENYNNISFNIAESMNWFHLAAESGDAEAQYLLGGRYGRLQNNNKTVQYYKLAATGGHTNAMCELGLMYEYGKNDLKKNEEEAMKWYSLATEQGSDQYGENGLKKSEEEEIKWYNLENENENESEQGSERGKYLLRHIKKEKKKRERNIKVGIGVLVVSLITTLVVVRLLSRAKAKKIK